MFGETPTLKWIFRVPGLLFVGVAMFVGCGIGNWHLKTQYIYILILKIMWDPHLKKHLRLYDVSQKMFAGYLEDHRC